MIGCFNHRVVSLDAEDSGYEKFILVLEANCISNLSQNHTLTTDNPQNICERVTTTKFQKIWCFCGDSLLDVQVLQLYGLKGQLVFYSIIQALLTPQRACVAWIAVLSVCLCVLLNISLFTWLFVPQTILTFSAADEGRKF